MDRRWIATGLVGITACAVACVLLWPRTEWAVAVLAARDDPAALSDIQLDSALRNDPGLLAREAEAALAAGDIDLADSFAEVAVARNTILSEGLRTRITDAVAQENSVGRLAERFAGGLVTGQAEDAAGLTGVIAGDLFVFGDIRDVLREGKHVVMGEDGDRVILGLAAAGLAVTAATYLSAGGAAPVRAGLTMVKDARKAGRMSAGLSRWAGRSARDLVDAPVLQKALATGSFARPDRVVPAVKTAFRMEKAGALVRVAKDVGRIGKRAGTRGAFDAMKLAEGPKDIARAARLAEAKGGQTRAILKMLGRGALVLAVGAFDLALWLFWALIAAFGFIVSIKTTTERFTLSLLRRRKAARAKLCHVAISASPAIA
ncbi:MAG: hypothetical protein J0H32_14940 [Rhizobiales bacterium]|nr:hypothetical protein [Hyphomicrobiales bacterium]MBN8985726.1 hypothetical protein [Hyphomicrobiales bacterium]